VSRRCYFDTSAAAKLILDEPESTEVERWVNDVAIDAVSSMLLETELRRIAWLRELPQEEISELLAKFDLYKVQDWEWRAAGLIPDRHLRSLDALHVASALRIEADAIVTYDDRMAEAAVGMGLAVIQPGRG